MRIADYIQDSIVDGPGLRFTYCLPRAVPTGARAATTLKPTIFEGGREMSAGEIIKVMLSNPLTDGTDPQRRRALQPAGGLRGHSPGRQRTRAERMGIQRLDL
jgi:hypothetical protein